MEDESQFPSVLTFEDEARITAAVSVIRGYMSAKNIKNESIEEYLPYAHKHVTDQPLLTLGSGKLEGALRGIWNGGPGSRALDALPELQIVASAVSEIFSHRFAGKKL